MAEAREDQVGRTIELVFREEAGRIVSSLAAAFGLGRLELIEDALGEALLKAMRHWSYGNVPPNPAAWLMTVARNRILDVLRRDTRFRAKEIEIAAAAEPGRRPDAPMPDELRDDQLRLMFACCHPQLPPEGRIGLTLKSLCGFSVSEIARAFLSTPEAIAKRLARARATLREARVAFEIPAEAELSSRLDSVLHVLYLLFNEGYSASQGDDLIRLELCAEAIRLATLLTGNAATATPKTHALLALFFLQASRLPARSSGAGEILLLPTQDRSRWDKTMIAKGLLHLDLAATGEEASSFHLQAGIAAAHCSAATYEATDWPGIVALYDLLLQIDPSPIVELNRAIAVAKVHGPSAGLAAVESIRNQKGLDRYHLFYAVRAQFYRTLDRPTEAKRDYRRALELTLIPAEREFLERQLRGLWRDKEAGE
ncbi:MAG TPA: sigma-70 family RNA polymerase sigma factor [Chthoniobacterales bacterium]|nr:sigma-70 family RNA polymerase sigma factor [Chthoniobacterales bacterium]